MADRFDNALKSLARLTTDQSAIQLYRANFATPESIEALRFWAQGEYDRIQAGFISTDEVVKLLAAVLSEVIDAIDEIDGGGTAPCEPCEDGQDGRGVHTFTQKLEPTGAQAGDVWFVVG